jgi:hypothetical protein
MRKQHPRKKRRTAPKTVLRLPDLDQAKSAVLNSLTSADAQRGYRHAIDEFVEWYCSEPRLSFNRTVVLRYRIHLEARRLAPGTINLRLGAVRRLASGTLSDSMREKPASTNSRRTISGELAPGSVIRLAVNSTRFSFYSDTCRCRRPSDILAASSGFATPSTMASGSNRNAECVRTANGRIADKQDTIVKAALLRTLASRPRDCLHIGTTAVKLLASMEAS